jgi:hypothetical protein
VALASATMIVALTTGARRADADTDVVIDPSAWRTIPSESGPVNYYSLVRDPSGSFIRARYQPPWKTTVLGIKIGEGDRRRVRKVRWSWRALTLPAGGDECAKGRADSAAVVYLTWKSGLRYHALKYVWSAVGPRGATCDRKRNPFVAQDTVILESGGPLDAWRTEEIDINAEYRKHFEGGDPNAAIPDFVGIGVMSDGDQTGSESAADFGPFVLIR